MKENKILIGVAGTKAFYSDKTPHKDQEFAKDRNLLQLNMINDVLPEFITLALGRDTKGLKLKEEDLQFLEKEEIARRWVGVRAVAYDGFPTFGNLYHKDEKINNARVTTHLGSGGVSFASGAVWMSRRISENNLNSNMEKLTKFEEMIRRFSDSKRLPVESLENKNFPKSE